MSDGLYKVILGRHMELLRVQAAEPKLSSISFWNYDCSYVEADVDELLEAIGGESHFEDHGWVATPVGFAPPEFEERRVELDRMVLDAQSVWWTCHPRNVDMEVSTERIAVARIIELFEELVRGQPQG